MSRTISRSGHEGFLNCRRRYYLGNHWGGTGFDKPSMPLEPAIGLGVHAGMAELLRGLDVDEALKAAEKEWLKHYEGIKAANPNNTVILGQLEEGGWLVKAFVFAWNYWRKASFLETFEVLQVEEELRSHLSSQVILAARCDAVIRNRLNGLVYVLNHKTCSDWRQSDWLYDIQMWTEPVAAQDSLGIPIQGCIIEGFKKGRRYQGFYNTPLVYGYTSGGKWSPTSKPGWKKIFIPSAGAFDPFEWIRELPPEVVDGVLLRSEPINLPPPAILEEWIAQLVRWQEEVSYYLSPEVEEEERGLYFEPRRTKWTCPECPFEDVCWGRSTMPEMIESGRLVERVDHHA